VSQPRAREADLSRCWGSERERSEPPEEGGDAGAGRGRGAGQSVAALLLRPVLLLTAALVALSGTATGVSGSMAAGEQLRELACLEAAKGGPGGSAEEHRFGGHSGLSRHILGGGRALETEHTQVVKPRVDNVC